MTGRLAHTAIIIDPKAEGTLESREASEPVGPRHSQTMMVPSVRPGRLTTPPVAETGLISPVVLSGEGSDNHDRQDASRTTAETQASPALQVEDGGAPSVLIIEDTFELAEIIRVTLERMNLVTAHESHGMRAFARFNEMNPDIVLLDIGLPDITGWKVLDSIKERQRDSGGKMPVVIVITAYGDPANRLVGKLHGVHSYLIKPFTPEEVERVVRMVLANRVQ